MNDRTWGALDGRRSLWAATDTTSDRMVLEMLLDISVSEAAAVGQIDDDAAAVRYACPVLWAVYDVTCKLPGLLDGTCS